MPRELPAPELKLNSLGVGELEAGVDEVVVEDFGLGFASVLAAALERTAELVVLDLTVLDLEEEDEEEEDEEEEEEDT
ncbi:unnamed protein product [Heligmosomoides polygyrus]|uniref:Uncharacterized protein n=1 Tax=Heligmosomoides polygyrus TaxID=6339 RepID=A0A183FGA5_HELPZ|nr:unnamed protein product [Heligmosomoides polygyrus]